MPGKAAAELLPRTDSTDDEGKRSVCELRLLDHLELVDQTGRALREDKRGAVTPNALPILSRLEIDPEAWLHHMRPKRNYQLEAMGPADALRSFAKAIGRRWLWGLHACAGLYPA